MKKGECSLCGKVTELVLESHIIPKFMYKGMEDNRNKIALTSVKNNLKTEKEIDYRFFEKNILCLNCERVILSQLENYGNRVLFGDQRLKDNFKISVMQFKDAKLITIEKFDYKKLKLFLFSILWRAHLSKHVFFKNIDLESRADELRHLIFTNSIDENNKIKISISGLMFNPTELYKVVAWPRHIIEDDLDVYSFIIHGVVYNFIYKDEKQKFNINENLLVENTSLKIPFLIGGPAAAYFKAFVKPSGKLKL